MKARVKATGEIIELYYHPIGPGVVNNKGEYIFYDEANEKIYSESEIEWL